MSFLDPVAKAIGLEGYATDTIGIGGVLKARVSDFRVDEISTSISLDSRGRFTVARITLTNWETNKFCNNLAKRLGISRNRIFFAGEATHETHAATVVGALQEGERAAKEVHSINGAPKQIALKALARA